MTAGRASCRRLVRGTVLLLALCGSGARAQTTAATPATPDPAGRLLDALRAARDPGTAAALELQLRALWLGSLTPAVQLLLVRARRELAAHETAEAFEDFGATLDLQPESPELYRERAQARFAGGDYPGAVRDIQAAITRQPRDFAAWMDLSRMAQAHGDARGAFDAWQRVLAIDPRVEGGAARLDELRRRAFGQPT